MITNTLPDIFLFIAYKGLVLSDHIPTPVKCVFSSFWMVQQLLRWFLATDLQNLQLKAFVRILAVSRWKIYFTGTVIKKTVPV